MKKAIGSSFLFLILIAILAYFILDAKTQRNNFQEIDHNLQNIELLNKDFDIYLSNILSYENFDIIQNKIDLLYKEFQSIKNNKILHNTNNDNLYKKVIIIEKAMEEKLKLINRVKSYRAVLNNSFRIIQKLKSKNIFTGIYTTLLTINSNLLIDINYQIKNLNTQIIKNKNDKYFIKHANKIFEYTLKTKEIEHNLNILSIHKKLHKLHEEYEKISQKSIYKADISMGILFISISILIILFLLYQLKLSRINSTLYTFRKTVENSDNIVMITDKNQIITYVNESFTKYSKYTQKDILGKKPTILRSGKQSLEFYKNLHDTIYSGKEWSGELINKDKNGNLFYEKASILPVLNDDGDIIEFIAIKRNTTKERKIQEELQNKENILVQQSKMAAMGEMLENIAHQWRQPLSLISTISTGMILTKELNMPESDDKYLENLTKINDTSQHLSSTIDNFRDFFKSDKKKTTFKVADTLDKTINLINSKFKSLGIQVIKNIDDIEITNIENELIQVFMNILNNARDVLESIELDKKLIFTNIYIENNTVIIKIKDNAGGISNNIINKIFEPYFTTKHKSQGTGIGLYMSQEMIVKHMFGELYVENESFKYEDTNYTGACFTIKLPLDISS